MKNVSGGTKSRASRTSIRRYIRFLTVCTVVCFLVALLTLLADLPGNFPARVEGTQGAAVAFRENQCIACHDRLTDPLRVVNRYYEWHTSLHREKEVGCERCHGGDASASDKQKAHIGVLPARDRASRLNDRNLTETCRACHVSVVDTFVESVHYRKLQGSGLGPSCSTCHLHMASEVVYSPEATAGMCARCHDSIGMLQPRPEIPVGAAETMMALRRAGSVLTLAERVIAQARERRFDTAAAQAEITTFRLALSEARVSWHAFNLETVRRKADSVFAGAFQIHTEWRERIHRRR